MGEDITNGTTGKYKHANCDRHNGYSSKTTR